MNRLYTLDRMEEQLAVLVTPEGREVTVPRNELAAAVREGMLVRFDETEGLYCAEQSATKARQQAMQSRVAALLARGKQK